MNMYVNEMFVKGERESHTQGNTAGVESSGLMQLTAMKSCLFYERIISKRAREDAAYKQAGIGGVSTSLVDSLTLMGCWLRL